LLNIGKILQSFLIDLLPIFILSKSVAKFKNKIKIKKMKPEKKIQFYRKELDEITKKLISLIAKREKVILKMAKVKKEAKEIIIDVKREREVLKEAKKMADKEGISQLLIKKIMKILIKHARKIQK